MRFFLLASAVLLPAVAAVSAGSKMSAGVTEHVGRAPGPLGLQHATKALSDSRAFAAVASGGSMSPVASGTLQVDAAKSNAWDLLTSSSRWSKKPKKLADVEDLDYFLGVPKLAWVIMFDVIACIFFIVGVKVVTALARKQPEQDFEVPLQPAV
eukprot:gb/GFBE01064085.1/.p1 GENE.gb/GFBE01064085.1/~~gb/GFBE01064085.1/.p1  ORF type:complete len:154 (+),score=40.74 gb/GFBE01064085.1/:1-462(+)